MTKHNRLQNKQVAFLLTDGYEDSELTEPWAAVGKAGAVAVLIAPGEGTVTGKKGHRQRVDLAVAEADADEYDALVLPGGVVNSDALRLDEHAVRFTGRFFDEGKPVGVICHGAWVMIEADAVRDRRLTSHPSLATDLRNAGADWVDEEVVVDQGLVSSRRPDDLPAFTAKLVEEIAEGRHPAALRR